MANQILRPSGPLLGTYNSGWQAVPPSPYYQAIDDIVSDGDATYLWTGDENNSFTVRVSPYAGQHFPRANRIRGVLVIATIRAETGATTKFKFRLRAFNNDFDSAEISFAGTSYFEVWQYYPQVPNGVGWSGSILKNLEIGLVYREGANLRCTKMEAHVVTEQLPHFRLPPDNSGTYSDFTPNPTMTPIHQLVSGAFDGDREYIQSVTLTQRHSFNLEDLPTVLPSPNIDRVQAKCLVRTTDATVSSTASVIVRSGGSDFYGDTNLLPQSVPVDLRDGDYRWTILETEFLNDPSTGWPSGNPAGSAWTPAGVNAIEIGVRNDSGNVLRCTSMGLDVFLKENPISTFDLYPTADGALADFASTVPAQPPGSVYLNIDENPPDDAGSYVTSDATTAGTNQYGSFQFGPGAAIPGGEQIYAVELRSRIRLGTTASCTLAHIMRLSTGDVYIGKPFTIESTGTTWFDIKEDFYTDPFTGARWSPALFAPSPISMEAGYVVLSGDAWISRIRLQIQTAPILSTTVTAVDFELTNAADTLILRSTTDDTIYHVTEFAVGTGGYNPTAPGTVLAVNKADVALAAEVGRFPINRITMNDSLPWEVTYWCRVPKEILAANTLGEIGLFATILFSVFPAEIGTSFMFAKGHFPGQSMVENDTILLPLKIIYP